jgi:hypothetical protein
MINGGNVHLVAHNFPHLPAKYNTAYSRLSEQELSTEKFQAMLFCSGAKIVSN